MNNATSFTRRVEKRPDHLFRRLAALRPHERRLFLAALPLVVAARVGLCCTTASRLQPVLHWLADATPAPQAHSDYADRAARAVGLAGRLIPGTDSLTLALATLTLMRRRGLTGRLRQDTRLNAVGTTQTYAWVEHCGRLIIGSHPEQIA